MVAKLLILALFIGVILSFSASSNVRIFYLEDIDFGINYPGSGRLERDKDICIKVKPLSTYSVQFWGSGANGAYVVSDNYGIGSNTIAFTPKFNDETGIIGNQKINKFATLSGQQNASTKNNCSDIALGVNANIYIKFKRGNIRRATAGNYRGTLTITITSE